MSTISDPQRRPVYFDRSNNRFLAEPVGSGPWPVISIEAATGVTLEGLGTYGADTWIGRIGSSGPLQSYGPDAIVTLVNAAPSLVIDGSRVTPASTAVAGVVRLNDATNSTSTTQAATANAVKTAYDLADAANAAVSGVSAAASAAEANAASALSTANAASATAGTALTTANAASLAAASVLGTANSALDAATEAESLASSAVTTANTAATVAMTAGNDAAAAAATANSALSSVESAQSTASSALSTANSALSAANAATSTANAAQSTANAAESTANAISATATAANATANSALAAASAAQAAVGTALLGSGGTVTGVLTVGTTGSLVFEGTTNDDFETQLTVIDPTEDRVLSLPNASGTLATVNTNQAFTGSNSFTNTTGQTFRRTATSDGILLRGSGSGTMAYTVEVTPASLSASRTLTAPNVDGTIVTTGDTGTVTNAMLAGSIAANKLSASTISGVTLGGNLNSLTNGTGLTGGPYNGSSAVTLSVDFGTSSSTVCRGNDSRLSDTRNTTNSLTFSNAGSGAASGTTFNGSAARTISWNTIGAIPSSSPNIDGTLRVGTIVTGRGISTGDANVEIGGDRTANGAAYLDFVSQSGADYNLRIFRNSGANGTATIDQLGGGSLTVRCNSSDVVSFGASLSTFTSTLASTGSYNSTTSSAANVFINSNGTLQRSTSSERYKTQIEDLGSDRADRVVLGARPVRYRSLCEGDNPDWTWYGLIAEEVAELDPRLVFWGRPTKRVLVQEASEAVLGEAGEVIEPAREAVYTSVKDTEAPLQPEGVQYDRLTVMLIDVVQRQQEALEALRARVQELEEHVAQG